MAFESEKYPKNKRETLKPEPEYIELLHSSIYFILPPQDLLNNNPSKKFSLKFNDPNTWPKINILP
jgi:hypothetical protein